MIYGYAWHIHHDRLIEQLTEPIKDRIAYIKASKPPAEHELRLRLLKEVRGTLPADFVALRAKGDALRAKGKALWDKGDALWAKGDALRAKGDALWDKGDALRAKGDALRAKGDALRAKGNALPSILALHAQECPDCPWDGQTIFPGKVTA